MMVDERYTKKTSIKTRVVFRFHMLEYQKKSQNGAPVRPGFALS
jgi:hypothetical protein